MKPSSTPTFDNATFPKCEHLKSKSSIDKMFAKGKSVFVFPCKVYYTLSEDVEQASVPPQVLFSVSKRGFKNATDRNRIKRQLRESYRLNKSILMAENPNARVESIAFVYVSRKKEPYAFIERKMKAVLYRLKEQYTESEA
ncbi:ribonuclease P protein component [Flammeovirga sp. SJP92]|uniref:ribonuclease P protein component n=1 Tax=Flammeovirga sp. SJP92 TaxID=1775430 RepID=UPI000786D7DF|nr:ribonuclease P protein component [Flammeovirga sp. SJP92]KXX67845.1 hypothetical protein AVL50_25640 [Flammeovirga sp. SJP92]